MIFTQQPIAQLVLALLSDVVRHWNAYADTCVIQLRNIRIGQLSFPESPATVQRAALNKAEQAVNFPQGYIGVVFPEICEDRLIRLFSPRRYREGHIGWSGGISLCENSFGFEFDGLR